MVFGVASAAFRAASRHAATSGGIRKLGLRTAAVGGVVAAACSYYASSFAEAKAAGALVMSGDCGGTNTRLILFRVEPGATATQGETPRGSIVFEKKYLNADNESFSAVCTKFLKEAETSTYGEKPMVCCLACAGGIRNNCVSFTNVKKGWIIDGNLLSEELGIPTVKLINDFEAQGYGLLTLSPKECIRLNDAKPLPGAPIACVGAGTGLGECFLTCANGKYTCWPSEGGHAEFSPRSELGMELLAYMKDRLTEFATPEKVERQFRKWDINCDGAIDRQEFAAAVMDTDMLKSSLRPKRISVERVVSGPGIADVYGFLRTHWAFVEFLDDDIDQQYLAAASHMKGAIVAKGSHAGQRVCKKAVDIFNECYGSEVGVAALKWLPFGGLYISGGIAAKNPSWIQSDEFMHAYMDKGRMSPLVGSVPLFVVLTEDTGERGALFFAVQMLDN